MSFFRLKNSLGAKMKKGFRTSCNSDGSTSTLNQQNSTNANNNHGEGDFPSKVSSPYLHNDSSRQSSPTLEDLILQLETQEEIARKNKLNDYNGMKGRMSCVNNSDILRSARNALNQYPRFSLDGRDSMYRSSFGNIEGRKSVCCDRGLGGMEGRKSVCCDRRLGGIEGRKSVCFDRRLGGRSLEGIELESRFDRAMSLPSTLAGESVVWCKPGVVAKLMGLEAMPVPVNSKRSDSKEKLSTIIRRQNLRRRFERHHLERRLAMEMQGYTGIRRNSKSGCCSKNGYCMMKPVALEPAADGSAGWQPRRYV